MANRIIVGSLAPQNWHRQARRLPPEDEMAERSYVYLAAWLSKHGYR